MRRHLANLALSASALLVCVAVVEGAARLYAARVSGPAGSRRDPLLRHSPRFGWDKPPGEAAYLRREEYGVRLEINPLGLRGPLRPYARAEGRRRILLLGDSFVEGYAVEEAETVRARLEDALAARGTPAEVLNGGTHGWSTDQELLFFLDEGRLYQPDLVVLFFYYNDLMGNTLRELKPWFELGAGGLELRNVPVPPPPPGADRAVSKPFRLRPLHGSVALRLVSGRTAASNLGLNHWLADLGLAERAEIEDPPREMWPFRQPADPAVGEAWTLTGALLSALRAAVEENGGRLVVFYVPARFELDARVWQLTAERFRMGRKWEPFRVRERLEKLARDLGLDFVDPSEALRAAERGRQKAYFPLDGHWSAEGHRLAAQALLPVARRALTVP